jgi:hypothetical protein
MTVIRTNSQFKVQAAEVETSVGIVPEKGALIWDKTLGYHLLGDGVAWTRVGVVPYSEPYWIDILSALVGNRLDANSTRYSADLFNGGVKFNTDSRYPNEAVVMHIQLNHFWKIGTDGRPHLHWKQISSATPNFLFGWKLSKNANPDLIEVDYSNFTLSPLLGNEFTYTSGVLNQISRFPDIDLSGAYISDLLTMVLFRDTANASGLFAGTDQQAGAITATDLDVHIQIDAPGSDHEYIK